VVAVLDTGLDARIPALASRLAEKPGRNFVDGGADVSDTDGHGTKVALLIAENCGDCMLLPLKLSRNGAGVRPDDLAEAIRYALDSGARVLNVSFGLSQGSPMLEAAVAEASKRGAAVVAAAGVGLTNPFRPEPLSKVYPQAYPHVVVVGVRDAPQNYGPELDVLLTTGGLQDSSFAAAVVSGQIARRRLGARKLSDPSVLQSLSHTPL
jgi:subtilisin family serine protease